MFGQLLSAAMSPMAALPAQLYSPYMTQANTSSGLADLLRQGDANRQMKQQPLNRGVGQSVYYALANSPSVDVQTRLSPLANAFGDQMSNSDWQTQRLWGMQSPNPFSHIFGGMV